MFAGLISKEQSVSAWGDADKIMAALAPYSLDKPRDVWVSDRQLLLQVATRTGSSTAEIYRHIESGIAVAFWGRLDNRSDLIAQLDAEHKASDDELIALAWLKWGEHCPEKLIGDFAFAVASPKTGVVFLARDVMGIKPLFYRADAHGVFFASTAAAFKPLKLGTLTRSTEWMAKHTLELGFSHSETAYLEIKKLPPSHKMKIEPNGALILSKYHSFNDCPAKDLIRGPVWLDAYNAIWQKSITCRIPEKENIGTHNSGGIDSGTITAQIAKLLGDDVDRLFGFSNCYFEIEPELIMATAMQYKLANNYLVSGFSDLNLSAMNREIKVSGHPNDYFYPRTMYKFHELAQQNKIVSMFSGVGGDEGVTNSGAPARLELFNNKSWRNLYDIMPGRPPAKLARMIKTSWRARQKLPKYFEIPNHLLWRKRWDCHFINQDINEKFRLEEQFYHSAMHSEGYNEVNKFALGQLNDPFLSGRFEALSQIGSSYGLEYIFPLVDVRLVQQWLSTPTIWKIGPQGIKRYLHRCANKGVCPEKVLWRSEKAMGYSPYDNQLDIKAEVRSLNEVIEACPSEIEDVYDLNKARKITDMALRNGSNNYELFSMISYHEMILKTLGSWIVADVGPIENE